MGLSWLGVGLVAGLLAAGVAAAGEPVRVIFDTDIMGDVDDVGAVAVLHALAAGGEATCQPAVFTDAADPDFQKLLGIFSQLQADAASNPRADMLGRRPRLVDPECRYVYRP